MQSKFSHSGLIYEQTDRCTYTLETSDFEVTQSRFEDYIEDPNVSIEVWSFADLSDDTRIDIAERARHKCDNLRYGYLQLLSFAIKRLAHRIGITLPNFIRQGLVCCHVVLYGYQYAVSGPMNQVDPENWDTQELYDMVQRSGMIKVYEKKI